MRGIKGKKRAYTKCFTRVLPRGRRLVVKCARCGVLGDEETFSAALALARRHRAAGPGALV